MLNLNRPVTLSTEQITLISGFGKLTVDDWKKNPTKLRKKISSDLKVLQDDICVYCGCKINGTGDVEHIAHKAVHTEFMFTPKNLAYSCKTCNQTYKGTAEVIIQKDVNYEQCVFNIVHPYLDDVDYFFDTSKPIIEIKKTLSGAELTKAKRTFALFRWDSSEVTERRAERIAALAYASEHGTTISQIAIDNALTFIP